MGLERRRAEVGGIIFDISYKSVDRGSGTGNSVCMCLSGTVKLYRFIKHMDVCTYKMFLMSFWSYRLCRAVIGIGRMHVESDYFP